MRDFSSAVIHLTMTRFFHRLKPNYTFLRGYAKNPFFQSAQKFNTRSATVGFMHEANLDEGAMWPTAFALKELTAAEEARIGALVKKAVS
jgi:hypothetical protein